MSYNTCTIVMYEESDWEFDGEQSIEFTYWVPHKVFLSQVDAHEYIKHQDSSNLYKIETVELVS